LIEAIQQEKLDGVTIDISPDPCVCVVMAAKGYPSAPATGAVIEGLGADGQIPQYEGAQVFHAGTTRTKDGRLTVSGGRVLGVTASGATLPMALAKAYQGVERIRFDGAQFRHDIAARALKKR